MKSLFVSYLPQWPLGVLLLAAWLSTGGNTARGACVLGCEGGAEITGTVYLHGSGTGMIGKAAIASRDQPYEITLYTDSDGRVPFKLTVDPGAACTEGNKVLDFSFRSCSISMVNDIRGLSVGGYCQKIGPEHEPCDWELCTGTGCEFVGYDCAPEVMERIDPLKVFPDDSLHFEPGNLEPPSPRAPEDNTAPDPGNPPAPDQPPGLPERLAQSLSLGRNGAGKPLGRLAWSVQAGATDVSVNAVNLDPAMAGVGLLAELMVGDVRQVLSGAVLVNLRPVDAGNPTAGFVATAYAHTATAFPGGGAALIDTTSLTPLSQATVRKATAEVGTSNFTGIQVTSERPGQAPVTTELYSEPAAGGGGMGMLVHGATATRTYRLPYVGDEREETVEELKRNSGLDPFYVTGTRKDKYRKFSWGEERIESEVGTGANARTSRWSYHTAGPGQERVHVQIDGEGTWTRYLYGGDGKLQATYRPWLDGGSGVPAAPNFTQVEAVAASECVVDEYQSVSFPFESEIRTTKVKGQLQSRSITTERWVIDPVSGLNVQERQTEVFGPDGQRLSDSRSATQNVLVGTMQQRGRTVYSISSDGTRVSYEETEAVTNGVLVKTSRVIHGTATQPLGQPMRSLRQVTITGTEGAMSQQTRVSTGSGQDALLSTSSTITTRIGTAEVTETKRDGVVVSTTTTAQDGTVTTVDESGIETISLTDPVTGTSTYTRKGVLIEHNGQTLHDGSDLVTIVSQEPRVAVAGVVPLGYVERTRRIANSVSVTESVHVYDEVGQLLSTTDRQERVTTFAYETTAEGGRRTTETGPGGVTRITTYYRDGRLKSVTGTGVVPEYHTYAVSGGLTLATVNFGSESSPRWRRTVTDGQGRLIREEKPTFGGTGVLATVVHYNARGQRVKVERPGLAPQLYEYDDLGELFREGVDLNGNGLLDLFSEEPVTEYVSSYEAVGAQWWEVRRVRQYVTAVGGPGQFRQQETRRRLGGGLAGVTETISPGGGRVTVSTTVNAAQKRRTVTTTVSGNSNAGEQVSINGLTVFSKRPEDAVTTVMAYDSFERLKDVKGPQGDVLYAFDAAGRLDSETHRSGTGVTMVTSYTYVAANAHGAGQVASVTAPVSRMNPGVTSVTSFAYDALGRKVSQWGPGTYPVHHVYDGYGDYVEMWTSRTIDYPGSDIWENPATVAQISKTYWVYDASTGLQAQKKDHALQTTSYSYHASGQIQTRTWARTVAGQPLQTQYLYDGAGRLTGVDYSDNTPDVNYAYHRHGALRQMTDAAGVHTYDLLAASGKPMREIITAGQGGAGLLIGLNLQHGEDEHSRPAGYQGALTPAVTNARPLTLPSVSYQYQNRGQLSQVSGSGRTVTYSRSYTAGQHVLALTRSSAPGGAGGFNSTFTDDPALGPVEVVHGTATLYQKRKRNGLKIDQYDNYTGGYHLRPDSHWTYSFDGRGQVTGARKRTVTNVSTGAAFLLGGWDAAYSYDDIGNRTASRFGGDGQESSPVGSEEVGYEVNALNQYTEIENPRAFFVTGSAPAASTVGITLNGTAANRAVPHFWARQEVAGTGPTWADATLVATSGSSTVTVPKHTYVPPAVETPQYDADGNLVSDGRWLYVWDGENRLKEMTTQAAAALGGVPELRVTFAYDGRSRRIRKLVEEKVSGSWVTRTDTRFMYDGWNLMAEVEYLGTAPDAPPAASAAPRPFLRRTYLWGQDLSGSLQGAGGVGGLLAMTRHDHGAVPSKDYWVTNDLNGNVIGLITENGVRALYEYDPFGKPLRVSEPEEDLNPFLFSTKYTDAETGLCYYGYRYYDAVRGRWINRDPIEEKGGENIFAMCFNNSVSNFDTDGRIVNTDTISDKLPGGLSAYIQAFLGGNLAASDFYAILNGFAISALIADHVIDVANYTAEQFSKLNAGERAQAERYRVLTREINEEISRRRGCPPVWPVFEMFTPNIYAHTRDHMVNGRHSLLNYDGLHEGHPMRDQKRRAALRPIWTRLNSLLRAGKDSEALDLYDPINQQLDEFPYASTTQGGVGASVKAVPILENTIQGVGLSVFYRLPLWGGSQARKGSIFYVALVSGSVGNVKSIVDDIMESLWK